MKHDRPNKPLPGLPFLVEEAGEEVAGDERSPLAAEQDLRLEAASPTLPAGVPSFVAAEILRQGPPPKPFETGPFRLVARLAVGGMSEVWLADALQGPLAGRTVVLKRLLPVLRSSPDCVARFRAEARFGTALVHPNLARTLELIDRPPELFLVQELLGGETVGLLSAAARAQGQRLPLGAVLHALDGLLSALSFLHSGGGGPLQLIHGDVNPDNLVARPDGQVKLIDLGLAQPLGPAGFVTSPDGALRGTPAYMAPEQVKARPLSPRCDLFSAGVVLWELLANRPLFAAETQFETLRRVRELPAPPLRAVWPACPTSLERILVRALAKDEAQRFASADELAAQLRQAAHREGITGGAELLAAEVQRLAPRAPRADAAD